jgi:hypothetical protein
MPWQRDEGYGRAGEPLCSPPGRLSIARGQFTKSPGSVGRDRRRRVVCESRKEIVLKTTSWKLTACVAAGIMFTSSLALAGPNSGSWIVLAASTAAGQSSEDGASSNNPRAQSAELLNQAYQAMKAGQFEAAESLISKAEALKVNYGSLYLGKTPKKARDDLQRRRAGANRAKRPSELFAQRDESADKQADGQRDPFANRAAPAGRPIGPRSIASPEDIPPGESEPMPGLTGNQEFPSRSPFGKRASISAPPMDDPNEVRLATRPVSIQRRQPRKGTGTGRSGSKAGESWSGCEAKRELSPPTGRAPDARSRRADALARL